jgi:putative membrane protein
MNNSQDNNQHIEQQKVANHLSNERTLLAWIRTGVGVMAFGFVVVEFSLFTKELNLALEIEIKGNHYEYSTPIGILIVATGAMSSLFALLRYHRTKKNINSGRFKHGAVLLNILVIFIFLVSILLLGYLIKAS